MWHSVLSLSPLLHATASVSLTEWSVHPSTVIGLAALLALYLWRAHRGPAPGDARQGAPMSPPAWPAARLPSSSDRNRASPSTAQRLSFVAGLATIFLALNGPLHDLSDHYLFSAHMVQHLLLTLVAPPLLLWGTPGWMLRPLLRLPVAGSVARRVTRPIVCFAIFNVTVAAWHLPQLYNTAVLVHPVHIAQHLMFMAAAVLMWWPILSPLPELPRLSYPGQMLYCFLLGIPMSVIAIYIAYADVLLYPAYASAPRLWGIGPMDDQLIGGLIMWIPGGLFFVGVMSVVFFRWAAVEGGRQETVEERYAASVKS